MGALRMIALCLPLLAQSLPAIAQPPETDARLRFFAACAGRLSALMEHQWMFDGAASEATAARRAQVIDIVEAMMPPGGGRRVLNWRIAAKMAQAGLLTRATFNGDPRDAGRARRASHRLIAQCDAALPG